MGKSKKDANRGHYDRDKTYFGSHGNVYQGWTPAFKRWAKDYANRDLRRQGKSETLLAVAAYREDQRLDHIERINLDAMYAQYDEAYEREYIRFVTDRDEYEAERRAQEIENDLLDDYDWFPTPVMETLRRDFDIDLY